MSRSSSSSTASLFGAFALALGVGLLAASCSSSDTTPTPTSSSSSSSGTSGTSSSGTTSGSSSGTTSSSSGTTTTLTCTLGARGADSLKTTYSCPDQAAFDKCSGGDSTSCTPKDKKPGTVALGGACQKAFTDGSPGSEYELADDCAPIVKYGGKGAAKGSFCAFGYCTHTCTGASDCTDLASTAKCGSTNVCEK